LAYIQAALKLCKYNPIEKIFTSTCNESAFLSMK
jgi:hypothetical protein